MNGGGLELVAPGHWRGRVGNLVTFLCQTQSGQANIVSLTYGTQTVRAEPFSMSILPGLVTCSIHLLVSGPGVFGEILEQHQYGTKKIADFSSSGVISFLVEGIS